MHKIKIGDIIRVEDILGNVIKVKVLNMHGDKLHVRRVRPFGFLSIHIGKRIISRNGYELQNFHLLNPKIAAR